MKHLLPAPMLPEEATTDERSWYLLLQIGFPEYIRNAYPRRWRLRHDPGPAKRHLKLVRAECKTLTVHVRTIEIRVSKSPSEYSHYIFRFDNSRRDDPAALRLAEAFAYGMTLTSGLFVDSDEPMILAVPEPVIRRKRTVHLDTLTQLEESRPWRERIFPFPDHRIASLRITATLAHEMAWRVAAVTFRDAALFDATRAAQRV